MAEIEVHNLPPNDGLTVEAESLDSGSHHVDTNARTGVTDVKLPELLLLHVTATGEGDVVVDVGPGDYPPALAAGQGEVSVTVPAGETALVGPFESGRVQSGNGHVLVELSAGADVAAYRFPRNT